MRIGLEFRAELSSIKFTIGKQGKENITAQIQSGQNLQYGNKRKKAIVNLGNILLVESQPR
jgi:hypothetical protein